nr:hypothetical protein [Tanacetum cinerariifolium]
MIQSGSRDSGLSSSGTGFNQSGLVLILGSYVVLMSSESKIFISSGIDWFILDANLLREALEITLADQAHQFMSPPLGDAIMDFVNQLGYLGEIHFVSRMAEEFVQAIQTFLVDKANLGIPTKKGRKTKPHVIPYCRFTKLIIYYLGRIHNIHQRSGSPLNLAEDDLNLVNLKFIPIGKIDEVFRMKIPKELIINNNKNAPYYNAYMEMVAKHNEKITAEGGGKEKSASKADKPKKPVLSKQSKLAPAMKPKAHDQACVGGVAIREQVEEATRQLPVVEGKRKAIATDEQAAQSLLALHKPKRRNAETGADTNIATSIVNTKVLYAEDVQGEKISHTVVLEEKTAKLDEGQAGSDPVKTPESRPPPKDKYMDEDQAGPNPRKSHEALVGPNPEPMHDDFIVKLFPKVHKSLKHKTEEHVHLENPLSLSGTLSSMKNLDDAFTFNDQFLNDKPTEEEPGKTTVETKAESMVTIPIYQASTFVPPLSTPIIDISPPKLVASPLQEPVLAATTKATTTTLLLTPPP